MAKKKNKKLAKKKKAVDNTITRKEYLETLIRLSKKSIANDEPGTYEYLELQIIKLNKELGNHK